MKKTLAVIMALMFAGIAQAEGTYATTVRKQVQCEEVGVVAAQYFVSYKTKKKGPDSMNSLRDRYTDINDPWGPMYSRAFTEAFRSKSVDEAYMKGWAECMDYEP